ncbi:PLDc N-terminal domain-containing protein [Psychrobacter sp. UBA2769]|uniref:PLDc N-terminal domain-containing protein n=1 Tax=Psychrobacter sp. UBA2769 TaxID=1947348 RepID=UPI0025FE172A|nr:PLDc N-terminal domain-containing protein [Psychrobacter sp. UBA2769]
MLIDILLTIHFILLVLISLRVLSRDDLTAPARLAWIVILFVLPYFGVLVYWMFGEVHLGRNFAREREDIINKLRQHRPAVLGSDVALTLAVAGLR